MSTKREWAFDDYSPAHWDEVAAGNVDKTKSWVELGETETGADIKVYLHRQPKLLISADRDQWGTYITFAIGDQAMTVAQEDGTVSFVDSLIAALTEIKEITDIATKPPTMVEITTPDEPNEEAKLDADQAGEPQEGERVP